MEFLAFLFIILGIALEINLLKKTGQHNDLVSNANKFDLPPSFADTSLDKKSNLSVIVRVFYYIFTSSLILLNT